MNDCTTAANTRRYDGPAKRPMHLYDRRLARDCKRGMARRVARTGRLSALNRLTGGGTTMMALGCGLMLLASGCQAIRPPTPTPVPTSTAVEPSIDDLPGRGVQITGHGDATTIPITPEYTQGITVGISIVTTTHDGQSAFTVQAIADNQISVLVAATGPYRGARPLVVQDNVSFQVNADGNWTLRVEPLRNGGQPTFSGTGDNVSQFFDPPPPGQWVISGAGKKLFIQLHCVSGDADVVDDNGGPYRRTATITFSPGPCFWEVQSDGTWSLKPQA